MDDDFFAQEEEKNMNVMLSRNDKGVAEHPDENRKKNADQHDYIYEGLISS